MLAQAKFVLTLMALLLAAPGHAQSDTKATPESGSMRTRIEGTRGYYEPGNVKKDGDKVSFKVYPSPDPAKMDGDEYAVNCKTHEMSGKEGGRKEWSPASPLLAGESMYPLAKKLCEWGPGFWQKLTD